MIKCSCLLKRTGVALNSFFIDRPYPGLLPASSSFITSLFHRVTYFKKILGPIPIGGLTGVVEVALMVQVLFDNNTARLKKRTP
jgi:hypothetical protein